MSYKDCMAALNLEFTDHVPRAEYSADCYWDLVKVVTGIDANKEENRAAGRQAFMKAWDYAFAWRTPGGHKITVKTDMGHAVYASGGVDFQPDVKCPFKDVEEALSFDPCEVFPHEPMEEMVRRSNELYHADQAFCGDCVSTGGIYHTLFSGLIEIFGWEMLLLAGGTDEARFGKVIDSYARWISRYWEAWAKSDAPVIMSHDDITWTSGPVFAPEWYRKYIFPWYKKFWRPLKEAGKKLMFTSDGTYHMFFDDLVECGPDMFVMEPTTDMAMFAQKYGKTHGFVGNADTRILLMGKKDDIYREVKRCMDIGKNCPGFILAVGNHIPSNTPIDNAMHYNDAYMQMRYR